MLLTTEIFERARNHGKFVLFMTEFSYSFTFIDSISDKICTSITSMLYNLEGKQDMRKPIKQSKNKIVTKSENEVGPGVVQYSVQQTLPCKNSRQQGQNRNVVVLCLLHSCRGYDS